MPQDLEPHIGEWQYTGDITALGSLSLTMLAKSFEEIDVGNLDDMFPSTEIEERTIFIEQVIEGVGIMPVVDRGIPSGNFVQPARTRSFWVSPLLARQDDFIEQDSINQLRQAGTINQQNPPQKIVRDRVQQMVNMHRRLIDKLRADVLLGGIDHYEPRTNKHVNVSTQIPDHNFFKYNGYDQSKTAGTEITSELQLRTKNASGDQTGALSVYAQTDLETAMVPRREAFLFMDNEGRYAGVPWTDRRCDVVRCLQLIKQYFWKTNKNKLQEIVMSSELMTVLHQNEYISQFMGGGGVIVADSQKVATNTANNGPFTSSMVTFNEMGELNSLAGLRIRVIDGYYRDPADGQVKNYWPNHKVALVAPRHHQDRNATLGMTHHCVGESPDGKPGLWMRTGPDQQPPSPPGRTMQMGDAMMPFAKYPHWISVVTVAPESAIREGLILDQDLSFGTF